MSWNVVPLALVAAAFPASADGGTGWRPPIVLPARPLLDAPAAVRPAIAAGPTGVAAMAFVADTTRGARMAVALRPPGARDFLTPRTLTGTPDLNDAGGRAPAVAAGPGGAFAAVWLAGGQGARRTPAVVVSLRRPGYQFGTPHQVSRRGGRPLAAPPAVAIDNHGNTTVAWTEQRERTRRVVVVRIAPGRLPGRPRQLARGPRLGPAAVADGAVAWPEDGVLRLAAGRGRPGLALGPSAVGRAPALAATSGRLAVAWHAPGRLYVRDPAGGVTTIPLDGPLLAGPLLGLDAAGETILAWQDARGVLALTAGGRPQLVGSPSEGATLSTLSVASTGRALLTFLGSGHPGGEDTRADVVRVATRPAGDGFLMPVTLSKPGPLASLAAAAVVPGDGELVAWATSIGGPGAGLLFVTTRPRGRASAAEFAPPPPTSDPSLIA